MADPNDLVFSVDPNTRPWVWHGGVDSASVAAGHVKGDPCPICDGPKPKATLRVKSSDPATGTITFETIPEDER